MHTPGPWKAIEWACHAPTTVVSECFGAHIVVAECSGHGRHTDKSIADARLIAAALDLLTELEHELEELSGWMRDREISDDTKLAMRIRYVKIQEVIAKAGGVKP
jgi:hypothetical protein